MSPVSPRTAEAPRARLSRSPLYRLWDKSTANGHELPIIDPEFDQAEQPSELVRYYNASTVRRYEYS